MGITSLLKDWWHITLCFREKRLQFFHGNKEVATAKKYGYLFRACMMAGIELKYFDTEKKDFYLKVPSGLTIKTNEYYIIFIEVFAHKLYVLPPCVRNRYYVFDVGMNRGYTALYYAADPECEKVFGFELDEMTYQFALENFQLNPAVGAKIQAYNYGLLDKEEEKEMYFVDGKDGIATVIPSFVDNYWSEERKHNKNIKKQWVKQASEVFGQLFSGCQPDYLKILKIDCEGAEYAIFADLEKKGLLSQFDVIIGECHNGLEALQVYLTDFICVSRKKEGAGIEQFCFLNKTRFAEDYPGV